MSPTLQTFLLSALAIVTLVLAWRHVIVLRGLRQLTRTLRSDSPPPPAELKSGAFSGTLARLGREVSNLVAESTLARDLESSRRRLLEALLNEIEDALIMVDQHSEIRFSNRAARELFPSDLDQVGRSLIEVCYEHRIIETLDLAWEIGAKTQERFTRRLSAPPDGRSERTYLVEAEPLATRGIGQGAWVLIRDITIQLETERIRRDFVANASHELRTPLSIISGYLEMLDNENDSPDPAALARCIPTMRKHADRLTRVVDDMLTISKLESHEELLNREPFDFSDCIRDSIDHLQPLIEEKHARVHLDLPVSAPMIGDRFYWDQVFFNLIENALKQNREPGLNLTIRVGTGKGRYQIEVADDGIGIPTADLPHVFKRFYRVQKDHSQIVKGTGLGLSIVKRAVEAHHGTISVRSRPGRETAFFIEVPTPPAGELIENGNSHHPA